MPPPSAHHLSAAGCDLQGPACASGDRFQEQRTAAKLAAEMRKIGFEVTEKVGKTGVVAIYKTAPARWCWCAPKWTAADGRKIRPAVCEQSALPPRIAAATMST
jgi:hypothetical protein